MPNPFQNVGSMQGGPGMAPMSQSQQPQQGPMGPAPAPVGPPQPPQMTTESQISNLLGTTPLAGMMRQSQAANQYQSAITALTNQLRQAQLAGAPPTVISGLQAQLAEAQDAMRQAGMREMYNQQMNQMRTGYGGGSVGSGGASNAPNPYMGQVQGRDALMNQMIAAMFGMGGGGQSGPRF